MHSQLPISNSHPPGLFLKAYRDAADVLAADVIEAFGGRGTVRLVERRADAVVLERLEPGTPLSALVEKGDDDEAARVLVRTIHQMRADGIPPGVPAAADLGAAFARYLDSGQNGLDAMLVRHAARVYFDLCSSQTNPRLLHGDLHHGNILFDSRRGWIAIDPKGVVGEVEYEVSVPLRNPVERPDIFNDPCVFERRVACFARELNVSAERLGKWAFATAVLAAIWTIEDGDDPAVRDQWAAFAEAIRPGT